MGCLARMPLPALRAFSFPGATLEPLEGLNNHSHSHNHPSSSSAGVGGGVGRTVASAASLSSLHSRASYSSQLAEAWQPYFKCVRVSGVGCRWGWGAGSRRRRIGGRLLDCVHGPLHTHPVPCPPTHPLTCAASACRGTALRVFASLGLSGQLGRFTRPFLDYTAASARVDLGLTSPHVVGVVPDPAALVAQGEALHRPDQHRGFALEGRGAWHALSVSLAQQVVGPVSEQAQRAGRRAGGCVGGWAVRRSVGLQQRRTSRIHPSCDPCVPLPRPHTRPVQVRARMDARFALDPTNVPASEGERSTLKGLVQTALSVRPALLETVYGFDVVLPGTEGAARLAVWLSPKRRECMAELRFF